MEISTLDMPQYIVGRPKFVSEEAGVQLTGLRRRIVLESDAYLRPILLQNDVESIEAVCRSASYFGSGRIPFFGHKAELLHTTNDMRGRQLRLIYSTLQPGGFYAIEGNVEQHEEVIGRIFGEPIRSIPYYNAEDNTQGKVNIYQKPIS